MTDVIIDTNVAVVANRQNPEVCENCIDACIKFLIAAQADCVVLLDSGDEIRKEYADALHQRRPFELGTQFLIYVYQNQFNTARVRRIDLAKDAAGAFVAFPNSPDLIGFDDDDRKFAALARNTGTPVTNATDSDWANFRAALLANGIEVNFLCGCDPSRWFKENP